MSLWTFLGELALFRALRRLFDNKPYLAPRSAIRHPDRTIAPDDFGHHYDHAAAAGHNHYRHIADPEAIEELDDLDELDELDDLDELYELDDMNEFDGDSDFSDFDTYDTFDSFDTYDDSDDW